MKTTWSEHFKGISEKPSFGADANPTGVAPLPTDIKLSASQSSNVGWLALGGAVMLWLAWEVGVKKMTSR